MSATLVFPSSSRLTQGTIFSCGIAEDYDQCTTYGLVITARCDAVNDKTQTFNYLPVVPLDDWINRDGSLILSEKLRADAINGMRNVLKGAKLSPSILESEQPEVILETLFPSGDKRIAGPRTQFQGLCHKVRLIDEAVSLPTSEARFSHLAEADTKLADQVIRDLIQNKISGFYFLQSVEPDGDDLGYVILLREVHHMHRDIAELLVKAGIGSADYEEMCKIYPHRRGRLSIAKHDVAMPISMLISPHIEHLLQIFSHLFGRIGIPDTPTEYIRELFPRQPSFKKLSA